MPKLRAQRTAQQAIRGKLLDHKSYIARYGDEMPEVRDWQWGEVGAAKGGKADTEATTCSEITRRREEPAL